MKTRISSLALRRIRNHLLSRQVILAMIGAALVLGMSGPFGTFESLRPLPRFAYWALIVGTTYSAAYFVILLAKEYLPHHWPDWMSDAIAGAVAGPVVTGIVVAINAATFAHSATNLTASDNTGTLLIYCTLIAITVAVLVGQAGLIAPQQTPPQYAAPKMPALLNRLPFDKRGALVSLQAQDHYVLVTTTKGAELVLMRIGDAISETTPTTGFQTHRSHWVAQDQIAQSTQQGERGTLHTHNGQTHPVSRKFMPNLKSAGFFR